MIMTPIIVETPFDEETLNQIQELRKVSLAVSKKMLADVDLTAFRLKTEGFLDESEKITTQDVRNELEMRIKTLEERIANPLMVHEDELSTFAEILEEAVGQ